MKTKRTFFSIVVFLSVFWISILVGFNRPLQPIAIPDDHVVSTQSLDKVSINALSSKHGDVASISNHLYLNEEGGTDTQTDQNMKGIDGSPRYVPVKESTISDSPDSEDEPRGQDTNSDLASRAYLSEEEFIFEEDIEEEHKVEPKANSSLYADIGISIANSFVNIRDKANTESKIEGKLYKDSAARILDTVGDWYYIESGSVKGYVSANYIKTGIPDDELIEKYGSLQISVAVDGLNVREKADAESKKLTVIYSNEHYPVISLQDEWIKIEIDDDNTIGYVSKEYVELLVDFNKAISKQEEAELEKLQEEERKKLAKKLEEEKIKKETEINYREEVDYAQDDLKLLACLVHSEAGNQSYEGKLAVANVVLNRVNSRKYSNTIKGVIYQPGQFAVTKNGSLEKQLDKYHNYSTNSQQLTIKAAKAALSGANNIGSRLYFNAYKAAVRAGHDQNKTAVKIEDHLFW